MEGKDCEENSAAAGKAEEGGEVGDGYGPEEQMDLGHVSEVGRGKMEEGGEYEREDSEEVAEAGTDAARKCREEIRDD